MNSEIEYNALRNEVIKRIELKHSIISLALTTATAVLGFSISNPKLALLYPPLAMCFCCIWAQNEMRELQLCDYLSTLERKLEFGWSLYYKRVQADGSFFKGLPLSVLAPGSIFILTSIIALCLGRKVIFSSVLTITLSIIDILTIVVMIYLILKSKKIRLSRRSKRQPRSNSISIINGTTPSGLIVIDSFNNIKTYGKKKKTKRQKKTREDRSKQARKKTK